VSTLVAISERGSLTIPKELRDKYQIGAQAILAETAAGLLLKPAIGSEVETYSEERITEFQKLNEEALNDFHPSEDIPRC
jgi:bifunctional DNA-binding transcriptional regulator/antitoxin component of YhaV-PrlF toxin-antitoxin module